ncbi:MAG TPA: HD domain-containing phosphohydrolase [Solirubrobacteraceae bacterium]|nr:HD domain-containing phosphohydrolase [Solirubrobacteraceae bacterium]
MSPDPRPAAARRHAHWQPTGPVIGQRAATVGAVGAGLFGLLALAAIFVAGAHPVDFVLVPLVLFAGLAAGFALSQRGRARLEEEVETRAAELNGAMSELETAQAETVKRLSMAVEFRDEDTGAHIERIGRFAVLLSEQIGMDEAFCGCIKYAAPLHDVGKVAIPDAILNKPGQLSAEERAIVETHAEEGYRLVRGSSSAILDMAASIALSHHEHWDGTGYPRGVKGEAIPIEGRIVAVVDVFDALTSDRVYRRAFTPQQAVEMMRAERGTHFDPVLLDAFFDVLAASGPDARAQLRSNPQLVVESTLETFAVALEHGDAESAESVIATAIDDGIDPTTLHAEVIAPSLLRLAALSRERGDADLDPSAETIVRRVLATLARYSASADQSRERVVVVGLAGNGNMLALQMVRDQLAAAGFRAELRERDRPEGLAELIGAEEADAFVVGAAPGALNGELESAVAAAAGTPVVLAALHVTGLTEETPRGVAVLDRIDATVGTVESLLGSAPQPGSI